MTLATGSAALATGAQAQTLVDETDPVADAVGYVADAQYVDPKRHLYFVAGQSCATCTFYKAKPANQVGSCPLFVGKLVSGKAWCKTWSKKT
jgi:hypothetical protein